MANANDSFIDEVSEAVRRDAFMRWLRRWGWLVALGVLGIVAVAGWLEWRSAQAGAAAALRGEALLTALEARDPAERIAALSEIPREGAEGMVAALLLAGQQLDAGDAGAAAATLDAVAADGDVPQPYRDLAGLKAQMARGADADPAALEALAQPGAPFALLAAEQLAVWRLAQGDREGAREGLQAIVDDAEVTQDQAVRVAALLAAVSEEPVPPADPGPAVAPDPGPAVVAE